MLHSVKGLQGFAVKATDGEVGAIKGVYFDDRRWAIRHLVVETGGWLNERKVLISPFSVLLAEWPLRIIRVKLTQRQIRNSPSIDTLRPVSRLEENELLEYYGYPSYWLGPSLWGYAEFPTTMERDVYEEAQRRAEEHADERERQQEDAHLHGSVDMIGCNVRATDGTDGHVEDFLFDEGDWSIQWIVVDTRNWWPGGHVLISPHHVRSEGWDEGAMTVDLGREQLRHSPRYDPLNLPQRGSAHA